MDPKTGTLLLPGGSIGPDLTRSAFLARTTAGETTAIITVVSTSGIIGASVGDSRAWVIGERELDELTADQNKKRLGSGRASPVAFFRPRLDGTLVVASDGLWNYISLETGAEVVRGHEPAEAAEALRARVQLPSGTYPDDLGIVVLAPTGTSPA